MNTKIPDVIKKYTLTILIIVLLGLKTAIKAQEILIYGGEKHDVFLGCLNCNKNDNKSIWNSSGEHGSKFNDNCIWCKYGKYGGKYNDMSPFNSYASNPPVLVDKDGKSYGYFTANKYADNRTTVKLALYVLDNWEAITDNVSGYYDKIFNK